MAIRKRSAATAKTRSLPGAYDENWPDRYTVYPVADQNGAELPVRTSKAIGHPP
jgi:hypothetical protein